MKKISTLLLTLCLTVLLLPAFIDSAKAAVSIEASGKAGENISYTFDEETGLMTLTGTGATYSTWFLYDDQAKVKKLIIGEGITAIGDQIFNFCSNMTEVEFPESLERIGFYSFGHCSSLTELTIPDSVTYMSGSAFGYCTGLKYVHIGKGLKSLDGSSIAAYNLLAFDVNPENPYLSDIDGHLYTADHKTFICYAAGKTEDTYSVAEGVTKISSYAFCACEETCALKKIILPSGMLSVYNTAFRSCSSVEEIVLPEGLQEIGSGAFMYCKNLSKITLPESLVRIDSTAFEQCGITSIRIPASVTKIDSTAFTSCALTEILVAEENPVYKSVDKILYTKDGTMLVIAPKNLGIDHYDVPEGVKTICDRAFYASALKSITLPESVETIGKIAFGDNRALTEITIPKSVKTIGDGVFVGCRNLSKLTVMNPNATIGTDSSTLGGVSTTEIYAPDCCDGSASTSQKWAEERGRSFTSLGKAEHTMGAPVSQGNGTHTCACENCDFTENLACTYQTVAAEAATCTEDGHEAGEVCSVCGDAKTGALIPALGHDLTETEEVVTESTCVTRGLKKVTTTCSRCDYNQVENVEISKTDHIYVDTPAVNPTCTEDGLTAGSYCKECGKAQTEQTKVLATGHKMTANKTETIVEKAGYKKEGTKGYYDTCEICGYESPIEQHAIPAVTSITLSTTKYTYSGSAKKPTLTVRDAEGNVLVKDIDYTVSGSVSGTKVGQYTIKVNFTGYYEGTVSKTYTIVPKKTSITKATAIKAGFKVYWKKLSSSIATGYEIKYSTSSKFTSAKTKTITKYSTTSATISNLKKGKKYYVRVRVYKTVSGKKYYSDYSATKTVTTKK